VCQSSKIESVESVGPPGLPNGVVGPGPAVAKTTRVFGKTLRLCARHTHTTQRAGTFPMNASNFHDFLGQPPEPLHPKSWRTVCRAHKLARRTPAESHQNSLLRWIRPPTWCATDAFAACLDDDSRGLIVQLLLSLRDVATIKAFALVNRACARVVRHVLEEAQLRLQRALGVVPSVTRPPGVWVGLAGISYARSKEILWAQRTTWVHRPASILAHVSNSCELCGAPMGSRAPREGPVSLHACSACNEKHRVRFVVGLALPEGGGGTVQEAVDASAHCVKIKLYDAWGGRGSQAWIRARHMLSRKTQHRKRMLRKRGDISTTVQREQHDIEMTEPLRRFLSAVPRERFFRGTWRWPRSNEPELLKLQVEAWAELPAELPQDFTFSGLMGITETDELRRSAQAAVDRKVAMEEERSRTLAAFRKLYKEAKASRLGAAAVVCSSYFGATQLVDLCFAADALRIRALANKEVFGNIKAMREAVNLPRVEQEQAMQRLGMAARVLKDFLPSQSVSEDTPSRELYQIVIKRAGAALFHRYKDAEARLREVVDVCEKARVKVRLAHPTETTPRLALTFYAPLSDGKTRRIALLCDASSGWRGHSLLHRISNKPALTRLTNGTLKTLERIANVKADRRYTVDGVFSKKRAEARACIVQLATGGGWKEGIEQFRGASTAYGW